MQNLLYRALRKWHVNGATKLKLYSYIVIGKYSRICQNVSARGRPGGTGVPNVHVGPPNISGTTTARKLKLKIQLDVVKYSLWLQKNYARGRTGCAPGTGGAGPPNVNFRPPNISETTRARKLSLKHH